jgi:hypothetical protein
MQENVDFNHNSAYIFFVPKYYMRVRTMKFPKGLQVPATLVSTLTLAVAACATPGPVRNDAPYVASGPTLGAEKEDLRLPIETKCLDSGLVFDRPAPVMRTATELPPKKEGGKPSYDIDLPSPYCPSIPVTYEKGVSPTETLIDTRLQNGYRVAVIPDPADLGCGTNGPRSIVGDAVNRLIGADVARMIEWSVETGSNGRVDSTLVCTGFNRQAQALRHQDPAFAPRRTTPLTPGERREKKRSQTPPSLPVRAEYAVAATNKECVSGVEGVANDVLNWMDSTPLWTRPAVLKKQTCDYN